MPESDYVQPNLLTDAIPFFQQEETYSFVPTLLFEPECHAVAVADESAESSEALLDSSSLQTVLDMLCVITSAEELTLLEHLTDAQKRQVWAVTPDDVKQKLKQLRTAAAMSAEPSEAQAQMLLHDHSSVSASLNVGNWVVLNARPQLSASELMAVWEILEIQDEHARIFVKTLGTRTYPLTWMVIYPKQSSGN